MNKIKTLFAIIIFSLSFAGISYAQSTKQQANDIKNAGQAAEKTDSETQSRAINNAAWDGGTAGSSSESIEGGKVEIIGGIHNEANAEIKSSLESENKEDITPWKDILRASQIIIYSAMATLFIACVLISSQIRAAAVIGAALASIAAAACMAAFVMGLIIQFKYRQNMLGLMIAGMSGMLFCILTGVALGGIDTFNKVAVEMESAYAQNMAIISMILLAVSLGGALSIHKEGQEAEQQYKMQQKKEKNTKTSHLLNQIMPVDEINLSA